MAKRVLVVEDNELNLKLFCDLLRALVWTLAEPTRANRLLDLTGLTPGDLRARASDPAVLAAALGFLQAHQPDLLACAEELDVSPERLVAAQEQLA